MSVTHPDAVRNSITDLVVGKIDLGSGTAEGLLVFNTSGDVEVATLTFANPAFSASAAGIASANAIADEPSATGGTTTKFQMVDRDAVVIVEGSVGTSGQDINLSSNIIAATDVVALTSLTYEATP